MTYTYMRSCVRACVCVRRVNVHACVRALHSCMRLCMYARAWKEEHKEVYACARM